MSYSDCFVSMQPDYLEEIFDFYPEDNISFSIEKHQNSYSGIEDIKYVSDLSNNSQASFSFSLENFSEADRDELLDIYLSEAKANGISNSFLFKHPIYAEYFICKFTKEVEFTLYRHGRYSQQSIDIDIIGIDRNLINFDTWIVSELPITEYLPYSG